jgi:hypothetical protein
MQCSKCNINKDIECFYLRKGRTKRDTTCKACRAEYVKRYKKDISNGDRNKQPKREIVDAMLICVKCNVLKNVTEFKYRKDSKAYRGECKICTRDNMRIYYTEVYNDVKKERRKTDPMFRIKNNHRVYVYKHLTKRNIKSKSSLLYVGSSLDQLKSWLEFQFDSEMTWDNYGKVWTLDHVLPLSKFNLEDPHEANIAFNWKNLQPCRYNFEKSNSIYYWDYFNVMISCTRYIRLHNLCLTEYTGLNDSLKWLSQKYGNPCL